MIGRQLELVSALVALFDIEIQIWRTGKLHAVWWNNWEGRLFGRAHNRLPQSRQPGSSLN